MKVRWMEAEMFLIPPVISVLSWVSDWATSYNILYSNWMFCNFLLIVDYFSILKFNKNTMFHAREMGQCWLTSPSRTRYLLDIYISFCCIFFVGILKISFKYIQKHHPFNISIKHLENIFIKTFYVRYLKYK